MTAWLIRAGRGGKHAAACREHGVIALGWPCVADAREADPEDVPAAVRKVVDDVEIGDLVVTPDSPAREVMVGEVSGDYRWDPESPIPGHRHVRPVRWIDECPKDELPPEAVTTVSYYAATVLRLRPDHPLAVWAVSVAD